jgi:hypothetical protein
MKVLAGFICAVVAIGALVGVGAGSYLLAKRGFDARVYELTAGIDALSGTEAVDGADGADGVDGVDGVDGTNGADGQTPHIGDNGNWFVGETDTGVLAAGVNGVNGVDGNQNIRQLIWQPSAFYEYKNVDDFYTAFLKEGETSLTGFMTMIPLGFAAFKQHSEHWVEGSSYGSYPFYRMEVQFNAGVAYYMHCLSNQNAINFHLAFPDLDVDAPERHLEVYLVGGSDASFTTFNYEGQADTLARHSTLCPVLVTFTVADVASLEVVT